LKLYLLFPPNYDADVKIPVDNGMVLQIIEICISGWRPDFRERDSEIAPENIFFELDMARYWIAVASREHVRRGVTGGFAQVCHGKQGPLKLMKPGDWILYYSPVEILGQKDPCRRFTAIGTVDQGEPYQFAMSEDFIAWRRNVTFVPVKEAPIEPMIDDLSFIKDKRRWGFPFRRGCFSVEFHDINHVAQTLGVAIS